MVRSPVPDAGLAGIAVFQLSLVLGAPLGAAAWGGAQVGSLPAELRVASAVSTPIWSLAAAVVLRRGGRGLRLIPGQVARWGTWVLVVLLLVGAVMNALSPSPWERFLWAPYALLMAALCVIAARAH